ncbi:hypothetical protein [Sporosarcina sp. FSL K6-5500]|uniref:hypothetical protein n=1 Tax=Sporosarcina sp. FSL K6-5500 TaxID=2921558 RepID=UPI0030F998A5
MVLFVGYVFAFIGALAAYHLSEGKSKKRKYIVWGITFMLVISPLLSFQIGLTYGLIIRNIWAIPVTIIILFTIGFIIGLIILLIGIFKKKGTDVPV